MRPGTAVRSGMTNRRTRRWQTGFTLIEVVFAIGIFSLVMIGVLSIYAATIRQKDVMLAAADAAAIRSALPRAQCSSDSGGIHWSDLDELLPLRLRRAAQNVDDNTLESANPWVGAYILVKRANTRIWILRMADVPSNLREFLSRQVEAVIDTESVAAAECMSGQYCVGFAIEVDHDAC